MKRVAQGEPDSQSQAAQEGAGIFAEIDVLNLEVVPGFCTPWGSF